MPSMRATATVAFMVPEVTISYRPDALLKETADTSLRSAPFRMTKVFVLRVSDAGHYGRRIILPTPSRYSPAMVKASAICSMGRA